jgi:uncharacterized protein YdeI (YjbR/CyaY-like superfamily)
LTSQLNSSLKRPVYPMPDFVRNALLEEGLMEKYLKRPPYQQNDYIGWITRAKLQQTQIKRMDQMIEELKQGDKYMKMTYRPGEEIK